MPVFDEPCTLVMMTMGTRAFRVSLLLLCGASSTAEEGHDGTWRGRTSQGQEIVITVRNGGVSSVKLSVVLTLDSPCPVATGSVIGLGHRVGVAKETYRRPVAIVDRRFQITARGKDIEGKVSGTFVEDTVQGEIELRAPARSKWTGKEDLLWSGARDGRPGPSNKRMQLTKRILSLVP